MTTLAVAVCTLGRYEALRRCLTTVRGQTRLPDETIVVDASTDPFSAESVLVLRSRPWLTRQRNLALDATASDLIVFLDDDCEIEPTYLEAFERAFDDPGVVAAAGRFLNPPASGGPVRTVLACLFGIPSTGSGRFRRSTFPTIAFNGPARDVECLQGGNMAIRVDVARRLRFDESLTGFAYCEDDDIARRLAAHGRIRYVPEATLWHRPLRRTGGDDPAVYESLVRNAWYLRRKNWPPSRLTDAAFAWAALGLVLRFAAERRPAAALGAARGLPRMLAQILR